jgi:serine-type D-Ala-D-Ala carboxypeptidase/endopeptidase
LNIMLNTKLRNSVFLLFFTSLSITSLANSTNQQRPIELGKSHQLIASQLNHNCNLAPNANGRTLRKPEEIRDLLQKIVEGKRATGIAVGLVTPEGRCIVTAGSSGKTARPQIDGDTVFELGSITKALTGTLLADMVEKGELRLDETIGSYLPKAAQGNAELAAITFRQLTTHSAGISRVPMTLAFAKAGLLNPSDPYANYSESDFVADLTKMKPSANPKYAYSNTGGALLGMLLANRAGKSYSELVKTRLLDPIGMHATALVHATDDDAFAAQPHDVSLKPTVGWNLGVFLPTGGARSSVSDMMKLIDANLARKSPWGQAHTQLAAHGKFGGVAYNWHIARLVSNIDGNEKRDSLVWHHGGTFGSTSFVGFDVERGIGVVVLINTGALGLADEIAMHLWDERNPRPATIAERKPMSGIAIALIVALVLASVLLATRAHATLRAQAAASKSASIDAHAEKASGKFAKLRNMFFAPFVDRIDAAARAFAALATTLFVLNFVPITPLVANFGVHQLLQIGLALAMAYSLWAARKVSWKIDRTLWQWLGLLFGVLVSAFFLWIAL